MNPLLSLAESRISEALERGDLDDLPGAGKPLQLDDDRMVPEELRAAYRLLKNSGHLPAELEERREVRRLEDLLEAVQPSAEETPELEEARRRLLALRARVEWQRGGKGAFADESSYRDRLLRRLHRDR